MQISFAKDEDALEIARIHKSEINKGFMSFLGISFLHRFYKTVICYENSFCLVVRDKDRIMGFVAGSTNLKDFNKYFFKKYFLVIVLIMVSKIFNPLTRKKIKDNFFHIKRKDNLPEAELLSIAIRKDFHGCGMGSNLLARFFHEMDNRGVKQFKVLVGKELNLSRFYIKNGFRLVSGRDDPKNTSLVFVYNN